LRVAKKKITTKSTRPTKRASAPAAPEKKVAKKPTKAPAPKPILMTRPKPVAPEAEPGVDPTTVKSPFNKKELAEYRKLLLEKRGEILGDMSSMADEALRKNDSANLSHMPLHMADVGTDNYEQELTLGLVESERRILQEINEALQRVNDGTFGICQMTGKPISKARLQATPWAKYSIEAARMMERGGRSW
jgi:RNA polymerase-binding protein DksA